MQRIQSDGNIQLNIMIGKIAREGNEGSFFKCCKILRDKCQRKSQGDQVEWKQALHILFSLLFASFVPQMPWHSEMKNITLHIKKQKSLSENKSQLSEK